jgi:hypothetical protein
MRHLVLSAPDDPRRRRASDFLFGPDLLAAPVVTQGRRPARCISPRGSGSISGSLRIDETSGAPILGSPRALAGPGRSRCPRRSRSCRCWCAPARSSLLPPDVDTLSDYGASSADLVRWRIGATRCLLAFPRGVSHALLWRRAAHARSSTSAAGSSRSWGQRAAVRAAGVARDVAPALRALQRALARAASPQSSGATTAPPACCAPLRGRGRRALGRGVSGRRSGR